jgi:hypothetical protein
MTILQAAKPVVIPEQDLDRVRLLAAEREQVTGERSFLSSACTSTARLSKPFLMSVWPSARWIFTPRNATAEASCRR